MSKSKKSIFKISDKASIEAMEDTLSIEAENIENHIWINEPNHKITCSFCQNNMYVTHLAWDAIVCIHCAETIENKNPEYPNEEDIYPNDQI